MEQLALNIGSSSKKYAFRTMNGTLVRKVAIRRQHGFFWEEGEGELYPMSEEDYRVAGLHFIHELKQRADVVGQPETWQVSIRLVMPGSYYTEHHRIDDEFVDRLSHDRVRDPVHVDPFLNEVRVFRDAFPSLSMVAVSDTAFHTSMPEHERVLALPKAWCEAYDLARFGYHGLVLQSVVRVLREMQALPSRTIVCHLGSGSSVSALQSGASVATSMGYAPLEGIPMSTRAGDVPVGALLEVLRHRSYDEVAGALYQDSGLRALSGYTADMEVLVRDRTMRPDAQCALDAYVHRVACAVGAYTTGLGGLDLLVFSGGIGERSAYIRMSICERLAHLGVVLDPDANTSADVRISLARQGAPVAIRIVHPNEEEEMMRLSGVVP